MAIKLRAAVITVLILAVTVAVAATVTLRGGADQPRTAIADTEAPVPSPVATPVPSPAPQPTSTPEPLALRTCAEMLATGYFLTAAERQFFEANCRSAPAPGPASPSRTTAPQSVATPSPRPASMFTPANVAGMIEFTGGVWADTSIPVPYCVNPADAPVGSSGQPLLSPDRFAGLVQNAFRRWQDIPNSSIVFAYQGICGSDPWNSGDGVNTVGWGWLFGSAIGLADLNQTNGRFLRQSSTGQLFEVDILIDVRYAQSFDNPADYLDWRLQQILTHEAGHFLGLGHSNQECSIMTPTIRRVADLCWVEIAAAQTLYP